ncbi:winged helix-turn-helix domain-containing protein [Enterobacter bugandensis]|nr:winged helix-turn-helix domain-containing protein [Enterobacter bugandensis]EKS7120159.1 winged helix-turn-helix domain-containing protein [Enterobacter bugandensis]
MTTYLIQDYILFEPDTCSLCIYHQPEDKTILNVPATRCFEALLKAQGVVLFRNDLLEHGWATTGALVTSNSLNQAISLLRKNLKKLECYDEIIVTVNRQGYIVERNIKITKLNSEAIAPFPVVTEREENNADLAEEEEIISHAAKLLSLPVLLTLLVLILFILVNTKQKNAYINLEDNSPSVYLYIHPELKDKKLYTAYATWLLSSDKDLAQLFHSSKHIYINNTIKPTVFNFFFCDSEIYKMEKKCTSFTYVKQE